MSLIPLGYGKTNKHTKQNKTKNTMKKDEALVGDTRETDTADTRFYVSSGLLLTKSTAELFLITSRHLKAENLLKN